MVFNISYLSQIWFIFGIFGCVSLLFRSSWINLVSLLFPISRFVRFVSTTPYTQGQHNIVNFHVLDTLFVQFTKFGPLSFHLHVPFQTNKYRKKKIQNRKPILPLQKLKRTLLFIKKQQHLLQSDPFCNCQIIPFDQIHTDKPFPPLNSLRIFIPY